MHNMEDKDIDLKGKVVTFYSYKGGVGRSMSLVNIACLMAKQKKKVLLIDWDLEAPGLHTFFGKAIKNKDLGLVDFITDVIKFIKIKDNDVEEKYEQFLTDSLDSYIQKNLNIENSGLQIDLIKSGKFDNNYTKKLSEINWMNFYKDSPAFFRTFAQFLEKKYDYILIDSRTGLADTSGVCTMLMPQILVPVFVLNNQNIDGVIDVIKQSVNYRFNSNDYRNITVLPLPSRIDEQYLTDLPIWIDKSKNKFENLFKELYLLDECVLENYFNIAKIPYKPAYAYGENIPVLKELVNNSSNNSSFISYHYSRFLKLIEEITPIWDILSDEQLEINKKLANIHFQKGLEYSSNKEYEKAIIEYEKSIELIPTDSNVYNNLGNQLAKLSLIKVGIEKAVFLKNAIEKYKHAIFLDPNNQIVYGNLGITLFQLANIQEVEKEKLFFESEETLLKSNQFESSEINRVYNLSCLYAVWGKKEKALENLEIALTNKEITVSHVFKDDDWTDYKEDENFLKLLEKHKL